MYSPIRRVYLVSIYILGEYISRELFKIVSVQIPSQNLPSCASFPAEFSIFSKERWRACIGWLVECRRLHKEAGGWRVGARV